MTELSSDIAFQLEAAGWPALLVSVSGVIAYGNPAAQKALGDGLRGREFCAIGIEETASPAFISLCDRLTGSLMDLKFKNRDSGISSFQAAVSPFTYNGQKYFVFQLYPPRVVEATPPAKGELQAAHKQKLECALQLTRTVALDFKNALTTILGHSSYVLGQIEQQHPWRFSLVEVEKAAQKAAEIAHDLAVFSLDEKTKPFAEAGNLNSLVRRAVQVFEPRGNVIWSQQYETRLYAAHYDEAKLQQAFVKLLENSVESIEANPSATGQVSIKTQNFQLVKPWQDGITSLGPGNYVVIEIRDDGCGITQESLGRIFEPFYTTKSGHRGLGLTWVYGIITNHGGGVNVQSQPGRGTCVKVYLPATEETLEEKELTQDSLRGTGSVLCVDDEETLLALASMVLSSAGYKVYTANSGPEALKILREKLGEINLMITDMVMPHMSGRELIDQVRGIAPQLRLLCSTACVHTARNYNEVHILPKPYTSQELLVHVQRALIPK